MKEYLSNKNNQISTTTLKNLIEYVGDYVSEDTQSENSFQTEFAWGTILQHINQNP